jgi:aminopeptidase-like protein
MGKGMSRIVNISDLQATIDLQQTGAQMYDMIGALYPICRSITGDGFRTTMQAIGEHIPLNIHEVPSGTAVLDWTVPKEWNIRDAYIKNTRGERVVDFQKSNLHVLNYSVPVHQTMTLDELRPHLYSLPEYPDWIPYRTSYYKETWGFCLSHNQLLALEDGEYEVCIDSTLEDGSLTYAECFIQGESDDEILISCHACHPSLCNDNLSGMALATFMARAMQGLSLRYSYRFLFIPGTIGSITWLALNEAQTAKIKGGLVITCVGDPGNSTYKRSRRGNTAIDRAAEHVLKHSGTDYQVIDFFPYGYDERQYCSPGFNLPVGCMMRSQHGTFPEYHTSADNLELVQPQYLADSFAKTLATFNILENNRVYLNLSPKGEPQLGKRGLYGAIGGRSDQKIDQMAILWVLNYSDGEHDLLDIAERAGMRFEMIQEAAEALVKSGLLAIKD